MSDQSMDGQLLMTQVGSLPKPGYILEARAKAHRGELPAAELEELERQFAELRLDLASDLN